MTISLAASRLLLINLLATWFLVGLIWIIQLVHYPLFALIGTGEWDAYHQQHMKMVTVIVAPLMFIEAIAAAALVFGARGFPPGAKACVWITAGLVLVNWLSTAGVQVPLHNELGKGWSAEVIQKLVATNWVRTAGWTLRGLLLAYVAWQAWAARGNNTAAGPNGA